MMDDSFLGDYFFEIQGSSSLHSETVTLSLVFSISCDCAIGANEQLSILYLINKGGPKSFNFVENTLLNKAVCNQRSLQINGTDSTTLDWITEDAQQMTIESHDSSLAGLHDCLRLEGDNEEQFKLSMCYFEEPSHILVDSSPLVFYVNSDEALD